MKDEDYRDIFLSIYSSLFDSYIEHPDTLKPDEHSRKSKAIIEAAEIYTKDVLKHLED